MSILGLRAIGIIPSGENFSMVAREEGMESEDNIYPRLGLAVLHYGFLQISLGQLYPKKKCVLKVFQQNILYICRM